MASHLEDVPPPPYTETDVFSASGRDAHVADDTSRSTSSTNGDVIYTPPLTPRSSHHSNFAGEVDHIASSPAAAYFATRPAPSLTSHPHIVHSITLTRDSSPDSLPFANELASRDVRLEDWQTFANYLMPHYSAASNEQVIDRKLRAEAMTATNTIPNNSNNDDARSQSSGRSHAEAQLNRIRSPVELDAADQRQNVETTVREWNDGFFGPRRITIRVDIEPANTANTTNHATGLNEVPPDPEKRPIPGAWDNSFDNNNPNPDTDRNNNNAPPRRGFTSFFNPFASRGGVANDANTANRGAAPGAGGFRWGGINVEGDRVSIGNSFVADGRTGSVRIGGIVADENGITVNGRPMFGAHLRGGHHRGMGGHGPCGPHGWGGGGLGHRGPGGWGGWGGRGGWGAGRGSWSRGGGWGSWSGGGGWAGRHGPHHAHPPPPGPGEEGRGREEHRSPGPNHGERHRSRSSSASSVSSRTSSTCSESTVGSLPDYDDLRDTQLPVAKQHLQEWLQHPEQPITRDQVKLMKEQIKAAKKSPIDTAALDKAALRREVKDLLRDWKALKKQQKRDRKHLRREMKQRRRQEKRERRQAKRELKRAAREMRRECRHGPHPPHPPPPLHPHPPHHPPPPHHGPGPFGIPPFPPMPHMPPMPPMPHMPPFPGAWPGGHDDPHHTTTNNNDNNTRGVQDEGIGPAPEYTATASQAKYQAAYEMEARVVEKEAELLQLHERIAEEQHGAGAKEKGGYSSKMMAEAEAVEREIEELARELERLRTEADEEFAKELAEEEERRVRG